MFHDAAIPPDDFVANCTIPFEDLMHRDKDATDFWVCTLSQECCSLNSTYSYIFLIKFADYLFRFHLPVISIKKTKGIPTSQNYSKL